MSNFNKIGTYKLRESNGRFSSLYKKFMWGFKRVVIGFSFVLYSVVLVAYGSVSSPIVKAEMIKEGVPPIMQRIAGCESQGSAKVKGTHFDKNGQVLMRSNTNKTVDLGKYQINTIWFGKAHDMGYDLTQEKDNEEFAMWIYKNRGTGDWYSSANCWK